MGSSLLCAVGVTTVTPFISTRFPAESCSYTHRVDKESVVCVCVCVCLSVCLSVCVSVCFMSMIHGDMEAWRREGVWEK